MAQEWPSPWSKTLDYMVMTFKDRVLQALRIFMNMVSTRYPDTDKEANTRKSQ